MGAIFAPYQKGPLGELTDNLTRTELSKAQFLTWLKDRYPAVFKYGLKVAETDKARWAQQSGNPGALSGLNDMYVPDYGMGAKSGGTVVQEPATWWQSATEGILALATGSLAYKSQKAAIEANMRRAELGQPPVDYSAYGAPTVRTQIALSPEILARLKETGMTTALIIGAGVLAVMLLPKLLGGSRRGR